MSDGANALRQFGQGVSFGTTDDLEARIRSALGQGDYARLKAELERQRKAWADKNPYQSGAAELIGSAIPGIVGAFIPGGQAGTVATVGRFARAVDAPLERLLARYAPGALEGLEKRFLGRMAVGAGDEAANGALYSAGQAPTMKDVPKQVEDDLLQNMLMSLGVRGGTEGIGFGVKKIRKGKAK